MEEPKIGISGKGLEKKNDRSKNMAFMGGSFSYYGTHLDNVPLVLLYPKLNTFADFCKELYTDTCNITNKLCFLVKIAIL